MKDFAENLSSRWYWYLSVPLFSAYLLGLFVPLMDEDSGHHASIALRMYLTGDYVNLISNGKDYLDKPHLHFWLSALSYQIFGVSTFAYKFPSFLISCLGAYSTFRLGKILYNSETGILATLILLSSQAFILSNNDVRMDALLTGFIIFATWQLTEAAYFKRWHSYVLAALGMALAFSTKGMIGFVMPSAALIFLLLYQKKLQRLLDWRWIGVIIVFSLFIAPVIYCYYLQFDLHPEKVIRGSSNISGVKFILWGQNVERLGGVNWGKGEIKPFFYFHTMLWAFLPWSLIAYFALYKKLIFFIKTRFVYLRNTEFLTLGTIVFIFTIISFSHYQLPHYLNILFPFLAILSAQELMRLRYKKERRTLKALLVLQYVVISVCFLAAILLNSWAFPVNSRLLMLIVLFITIAIIWSVVRIGNVFQKIVVISVLTISVLNILMNGNFYPNLLTYQSGIAFAKIIRQKGVDTDRVYRFMVESSSFNFYLEDLIPEVSLTQLQALKVNKRLWIYTGEKGKVQLERSGTKFRSLYRRSDYRVTKVKLRFLNPKTRNEVCRTDYLIEL